MPARTHQLSSQHVLGHGADCPACEETKRLIMFNEQFGERILAEAGDIWLADRKRLSPGSRESYRQYLLPLKRFFESTRLRDIHIGSVKQYQNARQAEIRKFHDPKGERTSEWQECDGAARINHEVNTLSQILRRAGLWQAVAEFYEPLPLPKEGPGMALTAEEEQYWFKIASSRPRWMVAYCCDLVSSNTTAGPGEIRHLRLRDLRLEPSSTSPHGLITVRLGRKNEFRERPLPLNEDSAWAMRWLRDRYFEKMRKAGMATDPSHFILFHRAHVLGAKPDPTRPMGSWKKAHYAMREKVIEKFPRLARFRRVDFRHTCCTKLLEQPSVSYSTIEKLMGHRLGSKTKRIYDHVRDATLRSATEGLNGGHTKLHGMAVVIGEKRPAAKVKHEIAPSARVAGNQA